MRYSDFQVSASAWMEHLNSGLSDLNDLANKAKTNERVAKAFAHYCLTGNHEFKYFHSLASKETFARKWFSDLFFSLQDNNYYYSKLLARELLRRFFKGEAAQLARSMEPSQYVDEYAKYLNELVKEYRLKQKKKPKDQMKHVAERMKQVDFSNLLKV